MNSLEGLSGINHQAPLQVLSSASFSGSYKPKPRFSFHTKFLLLFWFGPFIISKQVQELLFINKPTGTLPTTFRCGHTPCSHDNLTKVTTGEKRSLQNRAAARGDMRSSTCTSPFCTWLPFKMGQAFCCNALSSTWLMQEPLEEACSLLLLHTVLQDNCVSKESKSEVERMRNTQGADWFLPEEITAGTQGSCQKRLSQQ